jgi:hypothetical protein
MSSYDFMTRIIEVICDFAVANDMNPDDTLNVVAHNILSILEICTFNNWGKKESTNE